MATTLKIGNIKWIHLVSPKSEDVIKLSEHYEFHEIIESDILEQNTQDKIDVYDKYIFIVLNFPKYNSVTTRYLLNEFDIIMGKNFIITITNYHTNHIDKLIKEFEGFDASDVDDEEKYKISPYYILYRIIDTMYDKAIKTITKSNKDINSLENNLFEDNVVSKEILESLMIKRRNVTFLKHTFLPQVDILAQIVKETTRFYKDEFDVYFEDIAYKLDKVNNQISILFENVQSLTDTYDSMMSIKINAMMKVLTMFTAIIGVITMISGIYGMNIHLPLADSQYGFYFVISMIGFSIFLMLIIFKYNKWI